jgi:hypothetical protein
VRANEANVLARLAWENRRQNQLASQIAVYTGAREKTKRYAAMLGAVCYRPEVDMSQGSWKSYVNPQK